MTDEKQNETVEEQDTGNNASEEQNETPDLEQQLQEVKDKYLRLFADFDNYKKRTAKEKIEIIQTATKDLMIDLLPVLDDAERAMKAADESSDVQSLREGMDLIHHKLFHTLKSKGLKPMDANGEEFDSNFHEALTEIPAPSDEMKGKVVDQVEKGYFLNDKIIRFAKVVVGK